MIRTLAVLALVWAAPAPTAVAAPATPAVTAKCVPISDMGVPDVRHNTPITAATRLGGVTFHLPDGTTQGPTTWYVLRLRVRVTMAPDVSTGTAVVSAATNERTAAQVELKPSGAGLAWSTVSAAEPSQQVTAAGRTAEISLSNFLQSGGVKGGANTLTFHAEVFDGAALTSVHILPETCLETTTRTPETLQVQTRYDPATIRVGDEFAVQVRVRNAGTTPVGEVRIKVQTDGRSVEAVNGTELTKRDLTGDWSGELKFRARTAGKHPVRVNVGTAISAYVGGEELSVPVREAGGGGGGVWLLVVGGSVAAGLIAGWLLYRRVPR